MEATTNESEQRHRTILISLGLALAVLAAYGRVWDCDFVSFDDVNYVTANDMVRRGVCWDGIVWAFSTRAASNWHPLTWISHSVDCQLYGLNAAGHHVTSLLLHLANSVLLFLLLQRMTRAPWRSALAAALFALHPMHVESVAWISERKDVLSAFFWMLTMWAWVRYVEEFKIQNSKFKIQYALALFFFALGLMAKPMLVTLPFILILLDYWPLQRVSTPLRRRLAEKIPFFILAAASCGVTFWAQTRGGAVISLAGLPLAFRVENAVVSYARYLEKLFWPARLAVFYPMPDAWPVWKIAGAGVILAGITGWVVWRGRARRYLVTGWLWFLGMLAPVIGLLQIGSQSMADRYTYLPSVGLFIMVIWTAGEWVPKIGARAPTALGLLAVAGCLAATPLQAGYWKNSVTLYRHAAETTESNPIMECYLGDALYEQGNMEEALTHLRQSLAKAPGFAQAHYNLGNVFLQLGRTDEAILQFQEALRLRPGTADYHRQLGNAFGRQGRMAELIGQYEKVLQIRPNDLRAAGHLAWVLATSPDSSLRNGARAVELASRADRLSGGQDPVLLATLAAAYAESGKFADAVAAIQRALSHAGAQGDSPLAAALREQLALYRAGKPLREAGAALPFSSPQGQ